MQINNNLSNTSFGMKFTFLGPKSREYARALYGGMKAQGIPSSIVYDELLQQNHVATEFDAIKFDKPFVHLNFVEFFKDAIKIVTK